MRWLGFVTLACIAATASGTSRPPLWAELADRARSLPAEFAADAMLRIAAAPGVTDAAWKRQTVEDAFHIAAGAQQPYVRRPRSSTLAGLFDKAYAQGLDACTLQCRAVHAMLELDYKKARELFESIPPPQPPRPTCDDTLIPDVSIFYATAGEVAARAFSPKEVAAEEPYHLLERYTAEVNSPVEAEPVASMLKGASLPPRQLEALLATLSGALAALRPSDACPSDKHGPADQCASPECRQLAKQFSTLVIGPNGYALTDEQKSGPEWEDRLRQYLEALANWRGEDDPTECFEFKSRFYDELFHMAPAGHDRDLLLERLLGWLQNNGYQSGHRVEWFYPVNQLIIGVFADPLGLRVTLRALRNSPDPVIALYADLERLLPRRMEQTIGLL